MGTLILRVVFPFIVTSLLSSPSATASPSVSHYVVTAWTAKDGLPSGNVLCITQDQHGYLWLGTSSGLIRFDGFRFVSWHPTRGDGLLGASVSALLAAHDGSLWVAFEGASGVSRIGIDEHVANFGADRGLPAGAVTALLEDQHHAIWAGGHGGLSVFRNGTWHVVDAVAGVSGLDIFSLFEDRYGTLWLGTSAGVFRKAEDSDTLALEDAGSTFVQGFAEDEAGNIWVTDTQVLARPLAAQTAHTVDVSVRLPTAGWRLLTSDQGDLWIAALGAGLFRIQHPQNGAASVLARFSYETHFVGAARSLFEDRDHNLWIGMRRGGLVRLSPTQVLTDIALEGSRNDGVQALAAAADGTVWVATGHSLNQFSGLHRTVYAFDQPLALFGDHGGHIWVASPRGVGPFRDGTFSPVALPATIRLPQVSSFAVDDGGALWLCLYDQGLFRWANRVLSHFDDVPSIAGKACNVLFPDSHGRMWIGNTGGGIAVFENESFQSYSTTDGLAPGGVAAISESRDNDVIWVSTANGISRISHGQVTTVVGHGLPGNLIPSLVEDDDGYLWVGVSSGATLMRVSPQEFATIVGDPRHDITYTLLDESDGLQGPPARISSQTAARGGDGRLWFVSGSGIAVVDPRTVKAHALIGPPHLDRVTVDGKTIDFRGQHLLLPRSVTLQIDYGAVDLSAASKLRFRHRLEGFSAAWEQADGGRQATYMNLPPGQYRFHLGVSADGAWNDDEALWAFTVLAPFYQRSWFYGGLVCLFSVVVAAAWWLRLRRVRNDFELVLAERARLSRELHDTTLQSLGAFKLQLELAAKRLDPSQHVTRDVLQRLRVQVTDCIQGAKRAVWELRTPALEVRGLVRAIQEMAASATADTPVNIRVSSTGRIRRCPLRIEEHLLRISQEAVSNAMRHGQPTEITITIEYDRQALILRVIDNGKGFSIDSNLEAAVGHWGLKNMQERAQEIRGQFAIASDPKTGTVVTVSVPI